MGVGEELGFKINLRETGDSNPRFINEADAISNFELSLEGCLGLVKRAPGNCIRSGPAPRGGSTDY